MLRLYPAADQKTAIQFLDNVLARMPFPVEVIQTDNSAEFGTSFHWHALDKGMQHVYIKPRTPRLNGRVEHSSSTRTGSTHKALPTETRSETSQLRYGFAEEVTPRSRLGAACRNRTDDLLITRSPPTGLRAARRRERAAYLPKARSYPLLLLPPPDPPRSVTAWGWRDPAQ